MRSRAEESRLSIFLGERDRRSECRLEMRRLSKNNDSEGIARMSTERMNKPRASSRRFRAAFRNLVSLTSASVIMAGLLGQWARDRSVPMALLMYLPVLPVSAVAFALDLACRGRALPRLRFALSALAIIGAAWTAAPMMGSGVRISARADEREVSVLHWNVQWGGGLFRSPRTWAAQRGEILRQKPDFVILSEAPRAAWVDELVGDLGPGASCARIENERGRRYEFQRAIQ